MKEPVRKTIGQLCRCKHIRRKHVGMVGDCTKCDCRKFDYCPQWWVGEKPLTIKKTEDIKKMINDCINHEEREKNKMQELQLIHLREKHHYKMKAYMWILKEIERIMKR